MTLSKILEAKSDYLVYHDSYSSAVSEILRFVEKNNYVLDDLTVSYDGEQVDNEITVGRPKPKKGHTNKISLDLFKIRKQKTGTIYMLQKKALQAQVYNRGTNGNTFELNMYIL